MKTRFKIIFGAVGALVATLLAAPAQTALNLDNLPLWFETGTQGQFIAHGLDSEFSISSTGAAFALRHSDGSTATVRMKFIGANTSAQIAGDAEFAGKINYFIGNNPARWRSGVPTFARVRLNHIYPGVNVVYYGNQQKLEYDFDLAAGVKPNTIAIRFDGAQKVFVNPLGKLVIAVNGGEIIQHKPLAYQTVAGQRHEIQVDYQVKDKHTVTFAVANYDHSRPLVIDPILSFSTFFGGNHGETGYAIALDANTNIYVAGQTLSTTFSNNIPLSTSGAFQTNLLGGAIVGDAFVAKFDNSGSNLLYFTYLGGSDNDAASALKVDDAGNAFIVGGTESADFPTNNALFGHIAGKKLSQGFYLPDAFVSELNPSGSALIYSTYLGGDGQDIGTAITLDATGNAYITGYTSSTNFPITSDAMQTNLVCTNTLYFNYNAFIAEIAPQGTNLNYCSYFGGSNYDQATAITLGPSNFIYVAGFTASTNFPTTNFISQVIGANSYNGHWLNGATNVTPASDAFVSKFKPNFAGLVYSTLLGGTNNDAATGIAADAVGNAYVVGWSCSTNFPNTSSGVQLPSFVRTNTYNYTVATNAFLTQVTWNGTNAAIGYSQLFGGSRQDIANGVALDAAGNVFIVGSASSTNFPTTGNNLIGSLRTTNSSGVNGFGFPYSDVFVTVFKSGFSSLLYSTYLGGSASDYGYGIAVDGADNAYITGQTLSTNFPTVNARQTVRNGTNDIFLAKILMASTPSLAAQDSGTNVLVTWPPTGEVTPALLGLETSTNLTTTNWTLISQTPVLTNGNYTYTFDPTNPAQFFRFHKF